MKDKIKNRINAGELISLVAAVQPPTGGNAPGKDPIIVFQRDLVLDGV